MSLNNVTSIQINRQRAVRACCLFFICLQGFAVCFCKKKAYRNIHALFQALCSEKAHEYYGKAYLNSGLSEVFVKTAVLSLRLSFSHLYALPHPNLVKRHPDRVCFLHKKFHLQFWPNPQEKGVQFQAFLAVL
jgi:hypothetical protein